MVPGILPVGLTLLAGPPKIGKSWLALHVAVGVACGRPVFGDIAYWPAGPRGVLCLALEDSEPRVRKRLSEVADDYLARLGRWTLEGRPLPEPMLEGKPLPQPEPWYNTLMPLALEIDTRLEQGETEEDIVKDLGQRGYTAKEIRNAQRVLEEADDAALRPMHLAMHLMTRDPLGFLDRFAVACREAPPVDELVGALDTWRQQHPDLGWSWWTSWPEYGRGPSPTSACTSKTSRPSDLCGRGCTRQRSRPWSCTTRESEERAGWPTTSWRPSAEPWGSRGPLTRCGGYGGRETGTCWKCWGGTWRAARSNWRGPRRGA